MDILELIHQNEGKTFEVKQDISSPDKILRTITAFANTAGGILIIGVEDETRKVIGVENCQALEETLSNLIFDSISPPISPNFEPVAIDTKKLLIVHVFLSKQRPHYMIKRGRENGVFVRLGSSNRQADTALREEISRGILGKTFDEYPLVQATINEMELSEIEHIAESQHVELRKVLSTLNLIDTIQGNTVPTYGAYLLFGRNRLRFFPDAWIQCGRFVGLTKTHILDYVDLRNPFHQALYEVIDFLKKHAYLEPQISLLKRKDQWSIPLEILREAIINAIIHADFSQRGAPIRISFFDNRIEVENPGILLPGLTIEDIKHGISKTRNPVIARVFRELGFIEQWGSGIPRMIAFAQNNDWPEPEFSEIGTRFRATIFLKKSHATQTVLPKAQSMAQSMAQSEHILMLLTSTSLSAAEIASLLGLKSKSGGFKRSLKQLLEENLIEYTIASKPNSRLQKYRLSSKGKETIKEMKQK